MHDRKFRRVMVFGLLIILVAFFDQSYQGRLTLAHQTHSLLVSGCRGHEPQRHHQAESWYIASRARGVDKAADIPGTGSYLVDARAEMVYLATARALNAGTFPDDPVMYPPGVSTHDEVPLGRGHLDCGAQYPYRSPPLFKLL